MSRLCSLLTVVLLPLTLTADPPEKPAQPRLDAHGHALPEGALARLGNLDLAHPGGIHQLAISPDGKQIVTAGRDVANAAYYYGAGDLRGGLFFDEVRPPYYYPQQGSKTLLWDAVRGKRQHELVGYGMSALTFSPDGKQLVAGDQYGNLQQLDPATGKSIRTVPQGVRDGFNNRYAPQVQSFQFLEGQSLVALHPGPSVQAWDLKTGKPGKLWDVNWYKQLVARAEGPIASFNSVAVSPDGKRMAWVLLSHQQQNTNHLRTRLLVYESQTNKLLLKTDVYSGHVTRLLFAPDGKTLAAGTQDELWLLDAGTGKRYHSSKEGNNLFDLAFVGVEGKLIASTNGSELILRDTQTGKEQSRHRWPMHQLAVSRDGQVIAGAAGSRVLVWDRRKDKTPPRLEHHVRAPLLGFNQRGELVTTGSGLVQTWDATTGKHKERREVAGGRDPTSFCPIRNQGLVYREQLDKKVGPIYVPEVFDLSTGRAVLKVTPKEVQAGAPAEEMQVSWRGGIVVVTERKNELVARCLELTTGKELSRIVLLKGEQAANGTTLARHLSPDGQWLAVPSNDGRLRVFATKTGKEIHTLGLPRPQPQPNEEGGIRLFLDDSGSMRPNQPSLVTFSGDSRYLATVSDPNRNPDGHLASIWDLQTGLEVRRLFSLPNNGVQQVNGIGRALFSPDNRFLALTSQNQSQILFFEIASGRQRGRLQVASGTIDELIFSPDGRMFASTGDDACVLTWDLRRPLTAKLPKASPLTTDDLDRLWRELSHVEADKAEDALWTLIRAPGKAAALLKERLRPVPTTTAAQIQELIDDLDAGKFRKRELAIVRLTELGEMVLPALRAALLKADRTLEGEQRLKQLVGKIANPREPSPLMRELRAVEVLERIGTSEAREVLQTLSRGAATARLTLETRAALERLKTVQP